MEMKKYLLLLLTLISCISFGFAQKLQVESFKLVENDLSAQTQPRKDLNDKNCALIKVQFVGTISEAEGNVVMPLVKRGNETWVYMPQNSRHLKVFSKNYLPVMVTFADFGIEKLGCNRTYVLVLNRNDKFSTQEIANFVKQASPISSNNSTYTSGSTITIPVKDGINIEMVKVEAGTFMMAAAATNGDVVIRNVIPKHLEVISAKLLEMGCTVEEYDDAVRVCGTPDKSYTNVKTSPYPGFPTDMQPQIAAVLALANGTSMITESIFEKRFAYVTELNRMGADITVCEKGDVATINGVKRLKGADVTAPDLRAGAALVIAGLCAEGYTSVSDIKYVLRGYEDFDVKMQKLGAQIVTISDEKEAEEFIRNTGGMESLGQVKEA